MKNNNHHNLEVASVLGAALVLVLGAATLITSRAESPPPELPSPPRSVQVSVEDLAPSSPSEAMQLVRVAAAPAFAGCEAIPEATKTRVHRLALMAAGQPVDPPATSEERRTAEQLQRLRAGGKMGQ